ANEYRAVLDEAIAEEADDLMEKYFAGEAFTNEDTKKGIALGILSGEIIPVLCGSSVNMYGIGSTLDTIAEFFPSPDSFSHTEAFDKNGEEIEVITKEDAPTAAFVFKTVADAFVGKMSYLKVVSGTLKADSVLLNTRTAHTEKISHIFFLRGKKQVETQKVGAGDIAIVTKLGETSTGDTLCDSSRPITIKNFHFPKPTLSLAILPKAKGDEEKISVGMHRLADEDLTFTFINNTETKQHILSGMGEMHLDVLASKLKNKFGTSVELVSPIVAYREAIKKKVKVEGKHKKQSGGHGQFGHVWIEFEPSTEQELIFEEKVFGGSVPRNFYPAVEKGLRDSVLHGVLAGYPVVNLKATLTDGSYHAVDSSEMAFKLAASNAYKTGLAQANPVILEPIGNLKVYIPDNQ
ncbi:MAG: EF-Tu/IF-2/RF-3 family GTPase, partial [archaeon]